MSIAQSQGINVPNDLSVVGFDDTTLATVVWPNITTVRQPIDEMATLAVSLFTSNKNKDFSGLKTVSCVIFSNLKLFKESRVNQLSSNDLFYG
ncbi:substrate-binding domain-containing protein [Shewanella sp. AC34-MNA-CIBAN-0136]|uniref:substrate-binding domain-containing protein n=1 Tax=Shewanella sp. AC34-MNA-CIBAN-0136 TaxID=3140463 RepID=UPI0033231EB3